MLRAVAAKKSEALASTRVGTRTDAAVQRFGCSERNALRIVRMSASTYRYKSSKRDESALRLRSRRSPTPCTTAIAGCMFCCDAKAIETTSSACTACTARKACRCG